MENITAELNYTNYTVEQETDQIARSSRMMELASRRIDEKIDRLSHDTTCGFRRIEERDVDLD